LNFPFLGRVKKQEKDRIKGKNGAEGKETEGVFEEQWTLKVWNLQIEGDKGK